MQAERSVVQTVQRKAASWDAMLVGPTAQTTAVDWAGRSAVQTATITGMINVLSQLL